VERPKRQDEGTRSLVDKKRGKLAAPATKTETARRPNGQRSCDPGTGHTPTTLFRGSQRRRLAGFSLRGGVRRGPTGHCVSKNSSPPDRQASGSFTNATLKSSFGRRRDTQVRVASPLRSILGEWRSTLHLLWPRHGAEHPTTAEEYAVWLNTTAGSRCRSTSRTQIKPENPRKTRTASAVRQERHSPPWSTRIGVLYACSHRSPHGSRRHTLDSSRTPAERGRRARRGRLEG